MNPKLTGIEDIKTYIGRGDFASAEPLCRQLLAADPDDSIACFFLAFILWRQGRAKAALDCCRRTLSLRPAEAGLLSDLGNLCRELGAATDALEALEASLRLRPGHPGTVYNRALVLDVLGREQEALGILDTFKPGDDLYPKARYQRGTIRQDLGDMRGAEQDFRECIAVQPDHAGAWHALAATRRYTREDDIFPRLQAQLERSGADPADRRRLLFALAKLHDDTGAYEQATDCLLQANRLVDAHYDALDIEARLGRIRGNFRATPPVLTGQATRPNPVFIVGLPRSGTTLVETLLERHPDITALGELEVLPRLVPEVGRLPDDGELRALGARYLDGLPAGAGNSRLVLDKMPENFWRLGHIAWMFPHAKIVYCQRDARDVAISNFFNLYATGNNFSYSMENLAHYAACHQAVMQHWLSLLPGRIFQAGYERLVTQPGECVAGLVEFLQLDPVEMPLTDPPAQRRRIRTASNWQARQAIYTTSIGRWKNYPRLAQAFTAHYDATMQRMGQPA
jgi:tetratricopeptide (TPR) repeat protein